MGWVASTTEADFSQFWRLEGQGQGRLLVPAQRLCPHVADGETGGGKLMNAGERSGVFLEGHESQWVRAPTFMNSFNLKALSPNTVTLQSGFQHRDFGRTQRCP